MASLVQHFLIEVLLAATKFVDIRNQLFYAANFNSNFMDGFLHFYNFFTTNFYGFIAWKAFGESRKFMILERIREIGGKFVVGKKKKSSHRVEDRLLRSNKFKNLQMEI
jgi:hypothetical protein